MVVSPLYSVPIFPLYPASPSSCRVIDPLVHRPWPLQLLRSCCRDFGHGLFYRSYQGMLRPLLPVHRSIAVSWDCYWEHLPWEMMGGQDWGGRAVERPVHGAGLGLLFLLLMPFQYMAWGGWSSEYVQRAVESINQCHSHSAVADLN